MSSIKKLEWEENEWQSDAVRPFGAWYFVNKTNDGWRITFGSEEFYSTREEAKEAAQKDYESLIKSALE